MRNRFAWELPIILHCNSRTMSVFSTVSARTLRCIAASESSSPIDISSVSRFIPLSTHLIVTSWDTIFTTTVQKYYATSITFPTLLIIMKSLSVIFVITVKWYLWISAIICEIMIFLSEHCEELQQNQQ